MSNYENESALYYDGSRNIEFSEEISGSISSNQEQALEPADINECRHLLGANPF
jgi:hypothetical protein